MLDSLDDSQLNYGNVIFTAGYNYQISRQNTIGLSYQFSSFNYSNFDQSIKNNIIAVSYARRITGKLAFQASGGPDIALIRMPLTTAPANVRWIRGRNGDAQVGYMTQIYGSFNAALQYQLKQVGMSAAYSHGVTGGSGVLAGAVTDAFTGNSRRGRYHEHSMLAGMSGIHGTAGYRSREQRPQIKLLTTGLRG